MLRSAVKSVRVFQRLGLRHGSHGHGPMMPVRSFSILSLSLIFFLIVLNLNVLLLLSFHFFHFCSPLLDFDRQQQRYVT